MKRSELNNYLDSLLEVDKFKDYSPNGLQVEGCFDINKIVTGVTACEELINKAIELNADAILVHHGFFWQGESSPLVGAKKRKIKLLLENNINLFGYHLPLDAHNLYGNNFQLAKLLNLKITKYSDNKDLILLAKTNKINYKDFIDNIEIILNRKPLHVSSTVKDIETIAICTGAAQKMLEQVIELDSIDVFITGEISESTYHIAKESNMHFISAGHHATERYGVKSLGEHLQEKFNLECEFIDINNPV